MIMAVNPIEIGGKQVTPILIEGEPAIQATDAARYLGLTAAAFTRKRVQWGLKGHVNKADTRRVWFKIKDLEPYTGFTPEE